MDKPRFRAGLLAPRYWLTWFLILLWWLLVQLLPFRAQMLIGRWLGRLAGRLGPRRRAIARTNIDLCFPELTDSERASLVDDCLEAVGCAVFDTGISWFWPKWRLNRILDVSGVEHLRQAQKASGVLLVGIHETALEIAAAGVNAKEHFSILATYRSHKNPVYDYVQRKGRERHSHNMTVLPRSTGDSRKMIRGLREKRIVSYLADQDYGRKHSVFVPFFGVPAATLRAPRQLVKAGKAQLLFYSVKRQLSGYSVRVFPPFESFAEGENNATNDQADAVRLNVFIEALIREAPAQYLWVHRRFKSRPQGEASLYSDLGD